MCCAPSIEGDLHADIMDGAELHLDRFTARSNGLAGSASGTHAELST